MLCTFVTLQRHAFRVILSVAKPKIIRYDFWQVKPPKARSRQSRASAGDRRRLCDGGESEAESKFRGGKGNAPRRNRGATATKGSVMDFRRLVIRNVTFCIARLRLPLSDPASARWPRAFARSPHGSPRKRSTRLRLAQDDTEKEGIIPSVLLLGYVAARRLFTAPP